jgi:hypothetical protein
VKRNMGTNEYIRYYLKTVCDTLGDTLGRDSTIFYPKDFDECVKILLIQGKRPLKAVCFKKNSFGRDTWDEKCYCLNAEIITVKFNSRMLREEHFLSERKDLCDLSELMLVSLDLPFMVVVEIGRAINILRIQLAIEKELQNTDKPENWNPEIFINTVLNTVLKYKI